MIKSMIQSAVRQAVADSVITVPRPADVPNVDTDSLRSLAIAEGLKKLLDPMGHFSICAFGDLCKLAGIVPDRDVYNSLHVLHCVNYRDMEKPLQKQVFAAIVSTFTET